MNDITFFIFAISVWVCLAAIMSTLNSMYKRILDMSTKITIMQTCLITEDKKDIYTQVRSALR